MTHRGVGGPLKDGAEWSMAFVMRSIATVAALLVLGAGCDPGAGEPSAGEPSAGEPSAVEPPPQTQASSFRCAAFDVPALGGLDSVEISGNSTIAGRSGAFDIFSNGDMFFTGTSTIAGGAYSAAGAIRVAAGVSFGGELVESGPSVPYYVPYSTADYIWAYRHNAYIGSTNGGRNPVSGRSLSVYGGDYLRLPHYFYSFDDLSMSGASTLSLTYSVTYIFVDGPIEISGGSTVGWGSAYYMLIVSMSAEPITISGSTVIARIYAPLAPIIITDGSYVEGAVVGRTLQMSGDSELELTQDGLHIWNPC